MGGVSRRGIAEAHRPGVDRELRRAHRRRAHPPSARSAHDHARRSISHRDGRRDGNRRANAGDADRAASRFPASNQSIYHVDATLTWEIDFWGKFRSATEAERATLLGTQWAARAVLVSVVDLVAQGYFTLRELDLELEIARRTLAAREESLRLTRVQEAGGIVSMLDVRRGRAARLHGSVGDHRHGTPDRAAGERAQHSPRAESRADSAWPSAGRSAGAARGSRRVCRRASSSAGRTSVRPSRR